MAALVDLVRRSAQPLTGARDDYDALLDHIGDARFVLLGEASHGTHEFYRERATITRRLIEEKSFTAVAVEADWPDAYRVNRYVRHASGDDFAIDALDDFKRFPTWMWRNADVVDFVDWLHARNQRLPTHARTGFYGLDLYSLHGSMRAVLHYLDRTDPQAASRARARYACFDHFGEDASRYGLLTHLGAARSCENEVVEQLLDLRRRGPKRSRAPDRDEAFFAEQNARLVRNAEAYYRGMFAREVSTWNLRDRHMAETLNALVEHLSLGGQLAKVVIWAHNSHLGDARATDMGRRGELNLGQLVREQHTGDCVLIGFTTHAGTVTAASDWDAPAERKRVRPSLRGSVEAVFHATGVPRFLLPLGAQDPATASLRAPHLQRAIGVVYRPDTERQSHYFEARLAEQFDAVLHFDETRAVEPLEHAPEWREGEPDEVPETYPFGV